MLPPSPASAEGLPNACSIAHRAASYAGPSVAMAHPRPCSPGVTVTSTPQGAASRRWSHSASIAICVSVPGGSRSDTFARAYGMTALIAPSTGGASSPMTETAGRVTSRSVSGPVPSSG